MTGCAAKITERLTKVVGPLLRSWRDSKQKPLKLVASEFGVSESTWSRWEQGQRFPSPVYIVRLSEYISRPICNFYHYPDVMCSSCPNRNDKVVKADCVSKKARNRP